jgi:hypothetical protein
MPRSAAVAFRSAALADRRAWYQANAVKMAAMTAITIEPKAIQSPASMRQQATRR